MTSPAPNHPHRFFRLIALLVLLTTIVACGAPQESPTSATGGGDSAPSSSTNTEPATGTNSNRDTLLTISQDQQATWVRNFNPFAADNRWPTLYGIYEPLVVYNTIKGEMVPWLATEWKWNADNTELTFSIRQGVQWSDGEAFDANDVAFTFQMFKQHKGLSGTAAGVWDYLSDVKAPDASTVVFTFSKAYTPGVYDIGQQNIVPEHIWKEIADPLKFTNETPVGTGPFTEIGKFENQIWELLRNPNYWQEGKPYIAGFRFPSYPGNDQANLATINGENDWAGNFIPDIEKTYIAKDSANNHYWFPSTGPTVMLYLNTTKAPFDNVDVRKAISMCINREQIVDIAMYGYTHPADATGLSDAYTNWKDNSLVQGASWTNYDVAGANTLLDKAGLKAGDGGMRTNNGAPLTYEINVVSGWTDWVSAVQIISENLKDCGIAASVKTYDFSAWFERVQKGDFDISIGWSTNGATPFNYYRGQMSSTTSKPIGEVAGENWQRFVSPKADELLDEFAKVSDEAAQKELAKQLQAEFVAQAPAIPLFPGPQWYEFNTTRFVGFPSAEDPYAIGSTYATERLLVLTNIKPK